MGVNKNQYLNIFCSLRVHAKPATSNIPHQEGAFPFNPLFLDYLIEQFILNEIIN